MAAALQIDKHPHSALASRFYHPKLFGMSTAPLIEPEETFVTGAAMSSSAAGESQIRVRRIQVTDTAPGVIVAWGGIDTWTARLNLIATPDHEIRQGQRTIRVPPRAALETSFRNVREPCEWTITHKIDQIVFDLPVSALSTWAEERIAAGTVIPESVSGTSAHDPEMEAFGLAAIPVLGKQASTSQFFIDHILDGVCAHIFRNFGSGRSLNRGGLAPWQERRAKELMDANRTADPSLADLAAACGLSVAHFSRAFRLTCGTTPHRWLMTRRIEEAQSLLKSTDMPLASIAIQCGFNDQAHFTNVISKHLGSPPGALRRFWRSKVVQMVA